MFQVLTWISFDGRVELRVYSVRCALMDDCLLFPTELDQDRRNQGLSDRPHDEHFSVAGVVGISIRVDLYELTRCRTRWHESGIQESD